VLPRRVLHAFAGLALGVGGVVLLVGTAVIWGAAVVSLIEGAGDWQHVGLYVVVAVLCPVLLLGFVWMLSAAQRGRFGAFLGTQIAAPRRMVRAWPQLGYHLLAPFIAPVVPLDAVLARTLLGPGRTEELAQRVASLARSRADIIAATDAERRRIERDLHDGAQQRLLSLALNLGMARATITDASGPARAAIESAHDEATQALAELREFVRGLHPAVLDDRGLDAALSGIAARAPLPVRVRVDAVTRCSPSIEAIAYFVVSEALTNVARHAGASRAEVTVDQAGGRLRVVVTDDGRGGASPDGGGTGLRGLAQRTAAVDGTLTIDSPPGGPTSITVELPCES
jgi:signal transduction histidine kinase